MTYCQLRCESFFLSLLSWRFLVRMPQWHRLPLETPWELFPYLRYESNSVPPGQLPPVNHQIVPEAFLRLLLSHIWHSVWSILYFLLKHFRFGITSDPFNAIKASGTSSGIRRSHWVKLLLICFCNINLA